jgi:hypothetical protein
MVAIRAALLKPELESDEGVPGGMIELEVELAPPTNMRKEVLIGEDFQNSLLVMLLPSTSTPAFRRTWTRQQYRLRSSLKLAHNLLNFR